MLQQTLGYLSGGLWDNAAAALRPLLADAGREITETYAGKPGIFLLLLATAAVLYVFFHQYRLLCCGSAGPRLPDSAGYGTADIPPVSAELSAPSASEGSAEPAAGAAGAESRPPRSFPFTFLGRRHPMERRDLLPLVLLTAVYALVAFHGLGDRAAPQQFAHFGSASSEATIDLGEPRDISSVLYYTGLWTGDYTLEFSSDGRFWTRQSSLEQPYSKLFQWIPAELKDKQTQTGVRYVRITARNYPLEMGEIGLFDENGVQISADSFISDSEQAARLYDEQSVVPVEPTYLNSTYFDEIYHARTAYENLRNIYPYEISHPPLGKLIIMLGIKLFGMTPFGWRFMGTLFGVLMLPILYVFLKNMFGKTQIAFCGTVLFAFDFMHFVQTRIATIDTYGVIFILLMYFFMYRYMTQEWDAPFRKTALPLLLSGLFFGLGAASKWTAVYAGAGLLVFYIIAQVQRGRAYARADRRREHRGFLAKTLAFSVLVFLVIPAVIYFCSYYPYAAAKNAPLTFSIVWDNQKFMLNYHEHVTATHPYASRWWTWLFDARPILYYLSYPASGIKSAFAAFGNPLVWWGGLLAMGVMVWKVVRRRSRTALFILIAYLSQIVPWMFITRTTFVYHYFPSALFLVFALTDLQNDLLETRSRAGARAVYGFTAWAVALFVLFYPVLTGIPTDTAYTSGFLRWFPSWPF